MVEEKLEPVLKLPAEMKERLETMKGDVRRARHGIKVMKELGVDTTEIEEKLEWADKVRATLLTEFT